ncbi:hypothetical protein V8E51_000084 [Hyaloscypha variabilis]
MQQSPSLSRPTTSGSDAFKTIGRLDNFPPLVVQGTIPSGVDEPPEAIANNSSPAKFQKVTELSTVRSAVDSLHENSVTPLLPSAWGTSYSGRSPKSTFSYQGDDELAANHAKIDSPFPRGDMEPFRSKLYRSCSQEIVPRIGKRLRVSRPKVKSGCITCKVRRIKCDETRPHCHRCQKFGRNCDGYSINPSKVGDSISSIRSLPRIPSANLYSPTASIHTTEDECRYFDFFSDNVAGKMAGFFESTFWTRIVVQESHRVPAIRHAAISIAALFKSMETAAGPELKVNVVQSFDKKHHEYALIQYLKAIQALKQYISASDSRQIGPALIACLLFVCFEAIQGSYTSAFQQIYGAIKILRSCYVGQAGSRPKSPKRVTEASEIQKPGYITPALRDQMARNTMLSEGWVVFLIEDYLVDEKSSRTTANPSSAEDSEQHQLPDKPNESHQTADKQSVHHDRGYSPLCLDFNTSSGHSPQPSEIFSTVETNFATPSTVSEISTPIFIKSPSVSSPLFIPQTKAEPARGNPHLVTRDSISRPPHTGLIMEKIIETIVRLDCYSEGLFFGIVPAIPPLIWDIHKSYHLAIPAAFSNLEAARRCWGFLMDRALQFYRRTLFNRTYYPQIADSRECILIQYRSYMSELAAFKQAFGPIRIAALTPEGVVADPAALVVSLYYHCTLIMLPVVISDSEMVYDAFLSEFRYIVDTCTRLISHSNVTTGVPRFTFDVGIIPPLHLTAIKCRDPVVRQEAIDLLFSSPRQEGMWDSVLSARIALWVTRCEEEGLQSSQTSRRDEVVEKSLGRNERKVPKAATGAIERWLEQLSDHADNIDLIDIVGMGDDGVAAEDLDSLVGTPKMETVEEMALNVPEENRVRLTVVEFHIPERYIKVKCQRALVGLELKEEREIVIAW